MLSGHQTARVISAKCKDVLMCVGTDKTVNLIAFIVNDFSLKMNLLSFVCFAICICYYQIYWCCCRFHFFVPLYRLYLKKLAKPRHDVDKVAVISHFVTIALLHWTHNRFSTVIQFSLSPGSSFIICLLWHVCTMLIDVNACVVTTESAVKQACQCILGHTIPTHLCTFRLNVR